MPRSRAISFKLSQNWSSRLTLVLWPAMTIERFETEDFTASPPANEPSERTPLSWRNATHKAIADRMISSAAIANTITQVLSSSMLANEANSLNLWPEEHSQRRATQGKFWRLSGDRGKTAAAAEGP